MVGAGVNLLDSCPKRGLKSFALHGSTGIRKENGNYYIILGVVWDNGKESGNYYLILG